MGAQRKRAMVWGSNGVDGMIGTSVVCLKVAIGL